MDANEARQAFDAFLEFYNGNGAGGDMMLSEAIAVFLKGNDGVLSEATMKTYRNALERFCDEVEDRQLSGVTVTVLFDWRKQQFDRGLSPYTVDSYTRIIKRLFNWLREMDMYHRNPARKLKRPHLPEIEPKAVAVDDVKQVLGYLAKQQREGLQPMAQTCRDRAIILFLLDTGCRRAGLVSVSMGTLDVEAGTAVVVEKGRGGTKRRDVFFGERTADALRDWLFYHPVPDGQRDEGTAVFVSLADVSFGERLSSHSIYHLLRNLAQYAGVDGRFNPHSFRHGAAREWLRNGADLATVSQLLGHASLEVTAMHYARWAQNELAELHAKYEAVNDL